MLAQVGRRAWITAVGAGLVLAATSTAVALAAAQQRVVAITVDGKGFSPSRVEAKKDENLTLRFTRTSDKTCAKAVVFPELGIEKPLPLKKPVDIVVPTKKARTLGFQCGMGMYKSKVVIH
jgi:plastocyanin domain-containing protein